MRVLFLCLCIICIYSCSSSNKEDYIKNDLTLLMSEPINIPTGLNCYYNGIDTTIEDVFNSKLKFVIYFDSIGCTSCKANRIYLWESFLEYAEKFDGNLKFYFIFRPAKSNINNTRISLSSYSINYPIFIDEYGEFEIKNKHLPKNKDFHSFLLDENNNVVLVGNPLLNKGVEELFYKKTQKLLAK